MNNYYGNASTDSQDGSSIRSESPRTSVEDQAPLNPESSERFCHKPGCADLRFETEAQFRNHILSHITLPSVVVPKLDIANTPTRAITTDFSERNESLKLTIKLKNHTGSDKPAFEDFFGSIFSKDTLYNSECRSDFTSHNPRTSDIHKAEVVQSKKVLSGPGGYFSVNGFEEVEENKFLVNKQFHFEEWSSVRGTSAEVELDDPTASTLSEERGDTLQDREKEPEEQDLREEEDAENDAEEEEEEEDEEDEEEEEERNARNVENVIVPSTAPSSPTPSEVLRPHGYLAPEPLVDDDSCYPRSPPMSPARMVEMNGSTSAVSGSDNDSGHSRSPAAFPGGSGTGSGGEEDSSGQQGFNWDDLVGASTSHENNESAGTSENGQSDRGSSENVDGNVASDILGNNSSSTILGSDPLMLPESNTSAEGEQESLNLLQNLAADPLPSEVDRGETEYMSLDRLGEASFCCEVCGERTQNRHVLEEHRAMAGHYKCLIMPECGQMVWSSAVELAAHHSSAHGMNQPQVQQTQSPQQPSPPQTSPQGAPGPGTPPVQQLAQQVQRLPMAQQAGYPNIAPGQFAVPVPQQQMSPQLQPQLTPPMVPQLGPHMPGQIPQRRPPIGYRLPLQGQPYGPGAPNQPPPGFSGSIQPRPLNTLVAQQPVRGQMQNRMPLGPGGVPQNAPGPRGMAPMSMRGQKRPGPVPQPIGRGVMPPAAKQRRVDGMMPPQQDNGPGKKSDAKAVANILATRGITVTPAGSIGRGAAQPGQVRQRQNMVAPPAPQPVTTLNLNSAISIIPTSVAGNGRQQNNSGFAVPQVRSLQRQPMTTNVDRPPRPPTVDLTGDGPPPPPGSTRLQMGPTYHRGRGRPSNLSRATCQICDKVFASPEMLNQHMVIHRGPGKLPYRCNLCNAQYPTQQGLQQHRQTYHKESVGMPAPLAPGEEMVIPLVDLKQPGVSARLSSLGIHHCIPLSSLGNQANGYFSLPVVSIDGSRPSAAGNLRSLGASGVLSIGPIKLVPK